MAVTRIPAGEWRWAFVFNGLWLRRVASLPVVSASLTVFLARGKREQFVAHLPHGFHALVYSYND